MANPDDTISVEIKDGVDDGVAKKLLGIADNAKTADTNVQALIKSLGRVKPNAFDQAEISASRLREQLAKTSIAEERLRTQTQRTQQQLAKTDIAINAMIASENKAVASKEKLAAASVQAGEADDARAKRIRDMVQASLQEVEARNAATKASLSSVDASERDASAAKSQAKAYEERVAALQKSEALEVERKALAEEVNRVLAVGVKTTEDLARAESLLDKAMAKGALSTDEQAKALATLDKQAAKIKPIANDVKNLGGVSAQTSRQITSLITNLAQGQWTAARANVIGMAQSTGLLNGAMAGAAGAAGGAAAALVGLTAYLALIGAAALKSRNEFDEFNKSLLTNGRISGATAGELAVLSAQIGGITHNYEEARAAVNALARDGRVSAQQLELVASAAASFAKLSGVEVKTVSKELLNVFDDPSKSAAELNKQYSFLTLATYKQVTALQEQGNKQAAATKLLEEFGNTSSKRLAEATNDTNGLAAAWQNVGNTIQWAMQRFKEESAVLTGSASKAEELAVLQQRMAKFDESSSFVKALTPDAIIKRNRDRITELKDAVEAQAKASRDAAAAQRVQDKAIAATDSIKARVLALDKVAQKSKEIADLRADLQAAMDGGDSTIKKNGDNFVDERSLRLISLINEKYKDKGAERAAKAAAKAEETRASALGKVTAQLDNEIARMNMLGPEREAQAQFDKIEESMIGRRIKLTDDEKNAIREKVAALAEARELQDAVDRIYEQAVGPLRTFNATLDAANKLVGDGTITWQQFFGVTAQAEEAYKSAIDPLHQTNKALDEQIKLLGLLPKQREIEAQIISAQNSAIANGQKLRDEEIDQLREKLKLLQQLNTIASIQDTMIAGSGAQQAQDRQDRTNAAVGLVGNGGFTSGDAVGALATDNPALKATQEFAVLQIQTYADMYAQIDALRQADVISDTSAQIAKFEIFRQQSQQYLDAASGVLGSLTTLQSSENKKQAAIGKKAAIAQTMINTYQSATSAFSAMSGIPYVGPILGAVAAAAAIAAGMANVQKIRSQNAGFMDGGYTGNLPRTAIAGPVHGQEFVFDASATSRIGVGNLEAMRRGSLPPAAAVPTSGAGGSTAQPVAASRGSNTTVYNMNFPGRRETRTAEQLARSIRVEQTREAMRSGA